MKEEGMKLDIFIGFADTRMWNTLSVPVKNKISKTAGVSHIPDYPQAAALIEQMKGLLKEQLEKK